MVCLDFNQTSSPIILTVHNSSSSYVLSDTSVSGIHCKVYAYVLQLLPTPHKLKVEPMPEFVLPMVESLCPVR